MEINQRVSQFSRQVEESPDIKAKLELLLPNLVVDGTVLGGKDGAVDLHAGSRWYREALKNPEARTAWATAWRSQELLFDLLHDEMVDSAERSRRIETARAMARQMYPDEFDDHNWIVDEVADGYWMEGLRRMSTNELALISDTMVMAGQSGMTNYSPMGEYPAKLEERQAESRGKQGASLRSGPQLVFKIPSILYERGQYGAGIPFRGTEIINDTIRTSYQQRGADNYLKGLEMYRDNSNMFMLGAKAIDVQATRELNRTRIGLPVRENGITAERFEEMDQYLNIIESKQKTLQSTLRADLTRDRAALTLKTPSSPVPTSEMFRIQDVSSSPVVHRE
ncbi:MAG: hypothetical protein KAS66_16605, partial [Candidatus Omnitrophica bacterium]|nr:hypothetical protein [Candidatus Omnitrophota bacterium]